MSQSAQTQTQPCPNCGAVLPVYSEYVTWCDRCGWNLHPAGMPQPHNLFESFYLQMGVQSSQGLFEAVTSGDPGAAGLPVARIAAFGMAAVVHLTTLGFGLLGLWLVITQWGHNAAYVIIGLLCVILAVMLFPRLGKPPEDTVSRAKFPTLFAIIERVSSAMGARPPDYIVIDRQFNASYGQVGLRQQAVITVGLPLMSILTPEEIIAILSHEVAHGVNGDPTRGVFVGSARRTLLQWYILLQPPRRRRVVRGGGTIGGAVTAVGDLITGLVSRILSAIPYAGLFILSHLLFQDSQRAEYLADRLAARVAGTAPTLTALRKFHYTDAFMLSRQQISVGADPDDLVTTLRRNVARMPGREVERIERVEMMLVSRLDATHPPTANRIRHIRSQPETAPAVTMTAEEAAALEAELMTTAPRVERELRDEYRAALYGMRRPARKR